MSAPPSSPRARVHASLVAGWLALVAIGMSLLFHESFEPGEVATAPPTWPSDSALELAADRHTLVVVVHPQCSCTRATLTELEWVTDRLGDRLATFVLFGTSDDVDWRASPLLDRALAIRGVTVVADEDAREAQRFGAQTSGQVYLFAPDGTLAFEGGITPSRAHAGDNVGRQRIVALVEG
ncbi:MAG TPA: hypothetical protein VFG69_08270, partial [Nannocystaceae bacterium]|nr:hypothetical protein [Nannocystaceae bacterium]